MHKCHRQILSQLLNNVTVQSGVKGAFDRDLRGALIFGKWFVLKFALRVDQFTFSGTYLTTLEHNLL